jgi:hypothetical protein
MEDEEGRTFIWKPRFCMKVRDGSGKNERLSVVTG